MMDAGPGGLQRVPSRSLENASLGVGLKSDSCEDTTTIAVSKRKPNILHTFNSTDGCDSQWH